MSKLKDRTHVAVALGIATSILAIFWHSFGVLAYSHNAVGETAIHVIDSIIFFLEWPAVLLESILDLNVGLMYYHSHVRGSDFWAVLRNHFLVNAIGWSSLFIALHSCTEIRRSKPEFSSQDAEALRDALNDPEKE